ncbi:MAG: hypothetical protein ABA06_01375 [Parcubacteria bacterium C7867-001]|nr:MAG: hypothetical protein ABA06_01375 [Parcubacteria bacterium C7867-001]
MNSVEELRDYIVADTIKQIESMSREELVQILVIITTTPLEQMDANELLAFRKEYVGRWLPKEHERDRHKQN